MYCLFLRYQTGNAPGDIHVHNAGRGVGKGGKATHIVYPTCFMDGEHIVNLDACTNNVSMVVACRCSVGLMVTHMAFVGGGNLSKWA